MTSDNACSFLNSVRVAREKTLRQEKRIEELETRCTRISTDLRREPSGARADAEQLWAELADERAKLTSILLNEIESARKLEMFLSQIMPPTIRIAAKARYVNLMTVPEIVGLFQNTGTHCGQRQIERFLHQARKEVEELLSPPRAS